MTLTPTTDQTDEPADPAAEAIPHADPYRLFDAWFEAARQAEPNDANAMALATSTTDGQPSARMVLLKGHGGPGSVDGGADGGFVFYTNSHSRKGRELLANPHAALLFHWKSLRRQIRIEGALTPVTSAEADAYFASRARASQLGAVASDQSAPLDARTTFIARYEATEARFADGAIDRPEHWLGFRLAPQAFEFWQDRAFRLHDRRSFVRTGTATGAEGWTSTLLYP